MKDTQNVRGQTVIVILVYWYNKSFPSELLRHFVLTLPGLVLCVCGYLLKFYYFSLFHKIYSLFPPHRFSTCIVPDS